MKKEIAISILSSAITAVLIFLVSSSLGLFDKYIKDSQVIKVSDLIVNDKGYRNVLLNHMKSDAAFRAPQVEVGQRGKQSAPSSADFLEVGVPFSKLETYQAKCDKLDTETWPDNLSSPFCAYAIHIHCKTLGYQIGLYNEYKYSEKEIKAVCFGSKE